MDCYLLLNYTFSSLLCSTGHSRSHCNLQAVHTYGGIVEHSLIEPYSFWGWGCVANHGGAWLITYLTTPVVAVSLRAPSSSSGYFWQPLPTNPVHAKHTQTVRAPILYISVRYTLTATTRARTINKHLVYRVALFGIRTL